MAAAPKRNRSNSSLGSAEDSAADGSPEGLLAKAVRAPDPALRAKYATVALSAAELDVDTQFLLLHQLYLSHLERRRFHDAKAIAEQMIQLETLPEVAHQDAARAHCALGDFESGMAHLRLAGRAAPPSRRGFHLWCLGSTLFALGCHAEAASVLSRSLRFATRDQALHKALLALATHAQGKPVDLGRAYADLAQAERQPGVLDWVGGALLLELGKPDLALELLRRFVRRNAEPKRAVGLRAEISHAKRLLAGIEPKGQTAETVAAPER